MDEKLITDLTNEVKGVAADVAKVQALPEDMAAAKADLENIKTATAATNAELGVIAKDLAEHKAILRDSLGKAGAQDFREEFNNFIKAVYHTQKGIPMPKFLTKAAADYVTDVDAQGGYLVPGAVAAEVTKLTLMHGQIWPKVKKSTMPAGQPMDVPWESTLASVTVRPAQGGTGTPIDPAIVWGADTLALAWYYGFGKIANEAMTAPGISIPDNVLMQINSQLVRRIEQTIVAGDDSGTDPHDGILVATDVNSHTAMATPTWKLVHTFVGECLAANEGAEATEENQIILTASAAHVLKGLAQGQWSWGDPAGGIPANLLGYELLTSPHALSTTHRAIMAPLGKLTVGWTGAFSVSFNESLGWTANETWVRASTHADIGLGNPDMYHKAVFTGLA